MRTQLSIALQGIVTQQLLPTADGMGRVVACEVLVPTPAIRNLIREGKTHQIYAALQTSGAVGMQTMDADLARLVRGGQDHPPARRAARLGARGAETPARRRRPPSRGDGLRRRPGAARHAGRPAYTQGASAMAGATHLRLPGDGPRRRRLRAASSRPTPRPRSPSSCASAA